ncbi:hypothetical protein EJ04DRAFT_93696 [Polyplosphaeria fusca]|uniref:Uncharacterized protein n=1 Tax=Polyplosphaeria fusca TaxID=682080 RepID=A0A9P4QPK3_9PLEO|nr:hypothetical protein EJ04DRAFT_93696 [Polyplosphaeria fusca]
MCVKRGSETLLSLLLDDLIKMPEGSEGVWQAGLSVRVRSPDDERIQSDGQYHQHCLGLLVLRRSDRYMMPYEFARGGEDTYSDSSIQNQLGLKGEITKAEHTEHCYSKLAKIVASPFAAVKLGSIKEKTIRPRGMVGVPRGMLKRANFEHFSEDGLCTMRKMKVGQTNMVGRYSLLIPLELNDALCTLKNWTTSNKSSRTSSCLTTTSSASSSTTSSKKKELNLCTRVTMAPVLALREGTRVSRRRRRGARPTRTRRRGPSLIARSLR